MVSLRNEVRKQRRAAEYRLVQKLQGFYQETEQNKDAQHCSNNGSVRVSKDADNQGLAAKIEEGRVCRDESARVCRDESDRVCSDESVRIFANAHSRVCANKNDAVQLVIPKEEDFRVSTDGENSASKGLMKAKMKTFCYGVDDVEDDVPIGKILLRSKKGDVLKKQHPCLQNDSDCEIPLLNPTTVKYDVPSGGNDMKVEQKDKGQKKKKRILRSDNDNSDILLQVDVPSGCKDVKVEKKDKVKKKKLIRLSNDDDNYDIPLQKMMLVKDDVPGRGKDAKVDQKDKGQKKKLRCLLNDDDNCDIPLRNMMPVKDYVPGGGEYAKVEQKDKSHIIKQLIPLNDNDGNGPSQNDAPVEDDVPCGGKDVKVEHQDEDRMKKQFVPENSNDDGDVASENSTPVKDDVPDMCKDMKVEENDKGCDLGRFAKFQEGDMVWAKVKSHPWWPGQVYNPIFAAPKARKHKPEHVLIAFFGDSSYGWFLKSDLVPFEPNYVQKSNQTTQRSFTKAVDEAVDEISRRAALGLMCACRNGDAFRPRKPEGYVNVDVQGYVTSGLYLVGQIEAAKNAFKPADMLSFVRRLAMSPGSGEVKCIPGIKSVAEVLAYRVATFVSVNEDYWEALRITDSTDAWDQYRLESEVVCRDSTAEPAPVDEHREIPKHVKVKNLARRSITLGKSSDKEDMYMLKRREGVNRCSSISSDDCLMNYVIQADYQQTPPASSEIKDEEGDDTDCIGTYVFKKRIQYEEAERKGERREKKKSLLKEGDEYKVEWTRNKEVVRKAFHKKPLDRENEAVESGQRLSKISYDKKKKKPTDIKNISNSNISSGNMFEAEGKCMGSDKSSEGEQQMGPATMCADEIDHTGNILQERPMSSGKESSDPTKLRDADSRDASNELQGMLASFMDVNKESFPVNDVEHGNGVLVAAKKTPKRESAALERGSNGEFYRREILPNVDLLACNTLAASEGQKVVHKAENVFENAGKSFHRDILLANNSIKPKILKSGRSELSFDESSTKVDNIEVDTETEKISNQLPVSSVDVLMDVNEVGHNFTPSLELTGKIDNAVIKKTKGFKRLVKYEKISVSKDTCDRRVKPTKRIRNNETCLFDDLEPPKKQRKVSEAMESKSEAPKDFGTAALVDDNQVLFPILTDQSEGNEIPSKDMCSADPRYCIREIMDDLLSLALNPFYGIERDCPLKVSQVFLKFRSLVYQKSLTSVSSLASKNLPSLHEIEADPETKNKSGIKESNSKDPTVEDGVDDESTVLELNEIAPQTSSKIEHSASQVLKTGKLKTPEAEENKKRKLEIKSGGSSSLKRLKKLKDLDSAPPKKSALQSSDQKSSGVLRGAFRESVTKPKALKKSHFNRSSNSSKPLEVPMALCMKFPPGFALPSEMQLKARFARYGPLDVSGTRIYCNSGSAQVVFKHSSDAVTAYTYATENSLFGQADVSFWLKQVIQPKKETSELQSGAELTNLSRARNDEVPSLVSAMGHEDFSLLNSLEKHEIAEAVVECAPKSILQIQPVVQLKSCLKKPEDTGIDNGKETTRVTFLLGREEPNSAPQIAMEEYSLIENVNIAANTSLSLENNTFVNPPIENNAMKSDPPNISHQMLYLLTKCNDIVTDIGRSLGYVPYCPL